MAWDTRQKLVGAFPSLRASPTDPAVSGARFDIEDRQTMSFLTEQRSVTRAVFWAWNSSSIPLINYFGLEGLVGPFNL